MDQTKQPGTSEPRANSLRTTQSGWTETDLVDDARTIRTVQPQTNQIRTTQSGWTITNQDHELRDYLGEP